MEVKGILEKIRQSKTKEEKKECFWALQVGFGVVKSAIWTVTNDSVAILALGKAVKWQTELELLTKIDASFSSAMVKLADDETFTEPDKVILAVPFEWVKENKIVPERINLLKKISKELELKLVGFVVIQEAVVHQLKSIEGIPPSAILVYLEAKSLVVSLVNLGKIEGSAHVLRSEEPAADIIEGLSRIKAEGIFPARILVYGRKRDLEAAKEEISSFSWPEKANFIHLPKVEALDNGFDIQSVALAGGREIAGVNSLAKMSLSASVPAPSLKPAEPMIKPEVINTASEPSVMGFIKEQDVNRQAVEPVVKERRQIKINFSFLGRAIFGLKILALKMVPKRAPAILLIIGIFLLILGGGLVGFYWYGLKAEITLYFQPEILEKEFNIKLDPNLTSIDRENLILPGHKVTVTLNGEKTKTASGVKLVGEPAKGEVTIYNDTIQEKTFAQSALITSASGLKFSLDEEVTVASKSGTAADSEAGKALAKISAKEIGPEANLAAGTEFTIGDYSQSDFLAKNETALSGGSSREVQMVTKDDQVRLLTDLTAELKATALDKLVAKLGSEQKLIDETLTVRTTSKNFSAQSEEEADELTLKLELEAEALTYKEADFVNLIEEEVRQSVPDGFRYQPDSGEVTFKVNKIADDGVVFFAAFFKTKLLPIFDLEKIRTSLAGKKLAIGQTYLENLSHVSSPEVRIKPRMPSRFSFFPRRPQNIKIELLAK